MKKINKIRWRIAVVFMALAGAVLPAHAVPSFARQTNLDCMTCHVSWPELTPTGRQFKLNGYTLGDQLKVPLAAMAQLSWTKTANTSAPTSGNFAHNEDPMVQQLSLFYSGKIAEHAGVFSQATYDGVDNRTTIDNVDVRYANQMLLGTGKLQYGFTLNNNPMVQDVYNTGATWGFPYASSSVAVTPNAVPVIEDLGQQVAGIGAYGLFRNTVYGEVSLYRTANHFFSPLRAGIDRADAASIDGYNPYWRLALQHEWEGGRHSAMVGTYGLLVDRFPDNKYLAGPTDRFHDIGFDAQYQYITSRHRITGQLNFIKEQQSWNPNAGTNPSDRLDEFRAKMTYYFQKQYGINLAYFSVHGNADDGLYNSGDPVSGSSSASPDSAGYIAELNYLPRRDVRLMLQYTGYRKFNGVRRNYDGFGRDATDNNTLYLLAWLMF
jgi:hypothetical protein